MFEIPIHLKQEILDGNCVAFVGAGFCAPAVPDWDTLLSAMATTSTKNQIEALIKPHDRLSLAGIFNREAAAQILKDEHKEEFLAVVNRAVRDFNHNPDIDTLKQRIAWLAIGVPVKISGFLDLLLVQTRDHLEWETAF